MSKTEQLVKVSCEVMVKCLTQLQLCTARQEHHLRDVFLINRKHVLNGISPLIIRNSFVYTEVDSPKEPTENRHTILPHPLFVQSDLGDDRGDKTMYFKLGTSTRKCLFCSLNAEP